MLPPGVLSRRRPRVTATLYHCLQCFTILRVCTTKPHSSLWQSVRPAFPPAGLGLWGSRLLELSEFGTPLAVFPAPLAAPCGDLLLGQLHRREPEPGDQQLDHATAGKGRPLHLRMQHQELGNFHYVFCSETNDPRAILIGPRIQAPGGNAHPRSYVFTGSPAGAVPKPVVETCYMLCKNVQC